MAYSYTGTSYDSIKHWSTPRAGNACRPCTDYDTHYNKPKGYYYCEGKTAAPVLNKFTITYDLNGGSGTTPDNESCTKGQTCTLNDGATTSFYRAGYVFKGWGLTRTATIAFTSRIFNADDIVYAVWEECGVGKYKPGSGTQAAAACSSCPELTTGFEYSPATTNASLTACRQGIANAEDANEYCDAPSVTTEPFDIECNAASDGTWGDCAIGNAWTAKPGSYVGIWKQTMPAEDVIENMCIPCGVGTYSEGGLINSCSECPDVTPGFEYLPTTGNDSLTDCRQGLKNPANINEFCETASGTNAEVFKIQCVAASDGMWGNCTRTGFSFYANPGSYVGITSQSQPMPIEDVVENICIQCKDGTWSYGGDATSCSACPALRPPDEQAGWKISSGGDGATRVQDCYAYLESYPTNCASGSFKRRYWGDVAAGYYGSEWFELEPLTANPGYMVQFEDGQTDAPACVECSAGTYSPGGDVHSCSACPTGYDDNPETGLTSADMCQINCPGGYYLAAANDATCSEVSPGYWAAAKVVNYGGTSTRTECASGLTTIGYGAGADEAADCGRVLHFGDDTLYLRSAKKTDHALHVGINGDVFYGNMGTDLSKGSLRIKLGDTTYSVYDDSM